jgi:hypothetical protein
MEMKFNTDKFQKKIMYKYLLVSLALIISSLCVNGQEKTVSVRFVSFPVSSTSAPIELLVEEGKSIPVELPTTCLSTVYKVPALSQWNLGKMNIVIDDKGKEKKTFKSYGKAKSTGSSQQLILVIRKGSSYEDGFKLIPLKYNKENFGGGEYFIMNTTKIDIGLELGTTKVALKPRGYKLVKPKASKVVNGRKHLYVKSYYRSGAKMKPFYSSTWRLSDNARNLVFFYHEPVKKKIRTHTIRSYIRNK